MKERLNNINKNNIYKLLPFFMIMIGTVFTVYGVEYIQRGDVKSTIEWSYRNINVFAINCILSYMVYLLLYAATGCQYISYFKHLYLFLLLGLANKGKQYYLNENLYPWELFLQKQVIQIFPNDLNTVVAIIVIVIFLEILILSIYFRYRLPLFFKNRRFRLILAFVTIIAISLTIFYRSTPVSNLLRGFNITNIVWNQNVNYKQNGLLLTFILNFQSAIILKPNDYDEKTITSIIEEIGKKDKNDNLIMPTAEMREKPDIIVLMSEAFWDPTLLKSDIIKDDPLPKFRHLFDKKSGWLVSPTLGGVTCNVEFELLTGFAMKFLPKGSIPYQQYIDRPIPTVISALRQNGYHTLAIHPFVKSFWNRDAVYNNFGFDEFIGQEGFSNAKTKRTFIVDDELINGIIERVNTARHPTFVFAISIQNHGPYSGDDKIKSTKDRYIGRKVSAESLASLETYLHGIRDADRALHALISHYQKSNRKTIIIFFGDHLPMLGPQNAFYEEYGFVKSMEVSKLSLDEKFRLKKVPLGIWANFKLKQPDISIVSASLMPNLILKLADIDIPPFYRFIEDFYKKLPAINGIVVDAKGVMHEEVPKEYMKIMNNYRLLQYDLLFGKQYGLKRLF